MDVQTNQNTQRDGLKKSLGPEMELETEKLRMGEIAAWAQAAHLDHLVTTRQSGGELWVHRAILELQTRCIRQGSRIIASPGRSWPSGRTWAIRWSLSSSPELGWGYAYAYGFCPRLCLLSVIMRDSDRHLPASSTR